LAKFGTNPDGRNNGKQLGVTLNGTSQGPRAIIGFQPKTAASWVNMNRWQTWFQRGSNSISTDDGFALMLQRW
jgi:hypothetical protein